MDLETVVRERIATLTHERDEWVAKVNQELAYRNGMIDSLKKVIEPDAAPKPEEPKQPA